MAAGSGDNGSARFIKSEKLGAQLEAYYKRLHALILRHLWHHADADDVLQTVYERVVRYLERGGSVNRLSSFIYRTARNLAIDKLRERDRNVIDYVSDKGEPDVAQDLWRNEPHELAEAAEMVKRLQQGLSARDLDLLKYRMAGMTIDEIAAVTGYTRKTIETYVKRLRSACRAAWKGE